MRAERLFYSRDEGPDGTVTELGLWRVPRPVPPSGHMFKYALYYGRPGERLVLFDNERAKATTSIFGKRKAPMCSPRRRT